MTERSPDSLEKELLEQVAMFRHYSGLRFVVLTLFFATTGALASAAFVTGVPTTPAVAKYVKLAGILSTVAFSLLEYALERYLRHFSMCALESEARTGFRIFSRSPLQQRFRTRHAIWFMLIATLGFWVYAYFTH